MILPHLAAWARGGWILGKVDRREKYDAALHAARLRGKPLLVVGEPDGEYPCPPGPSDVLVDLRERSVCRNYVRANVEDLSRFRTKQFGATLCSHVLEHVCDPRRAISELARVSDEVFVSYPKGYRLVTYLIPGHTWLITEPSPGKLTFSRLRSPSSCNVGNRYGVQGLDGFTVDL